MCSYVSFLLFQLLDTGSLSLSPKPQRSHPQSSSVRPYPDPLPSSAPRWPVAQLQPVAERSDWVWRSEVRRLLLPPASHGSSLPLLRLPPGLTAAPNAPSPRSPGTTPQETSFRKPAPGASGTFLLRSGAPPVRRQGAPVRRREPPPASASR